LIEVVLGAIAGVGAAACITVVGPVLAKRSEATALQRRAAAGRTMALTFDDGPGAELTPRVLDVLAAHGASASFFLLGRRAVGAPELVERLLHAGHEVGCHTFDHLHAWKAPPWRCVRDIDKGYSEMSRWMGPTSMFRPPYGKMTLMTRLAVRRRGAPIAWWTVDSGDTHANLPSPESAAERVAREGGGVVLMHDFDREVDTPRRAEFVVAATEALLRTAAREGLRVRRLSELLSGSDAHG
jgi:peptidoglycan/xylan/chitin deacetylase (PgdA/CDA1 family)